MGLFKSKKKDDKDNKNAWILDWVVLVKNQLVGLNDFDQLQVKVNQEVLDYLIKLEARVKELENK